MLKNNKSYNFVGCVDIMDKIEADLHIHSIYSDGTLFPEEILKLITQKDLKFFSITDHNCIGFDIQDPRFIPGIEISVEDEFEGKPINNLEILGYRFDIDKIKEKIEPLKKKRIENIIKCIDNFNKFDFESNLFYPENLKKITIKDFFEFRFKKEITHEELNSLIQKCYISKIDLAEFLYTKFFKPNPKLQETYGDPHLLFNNEFSTTIFNTPKDKKPTFKEAINMIKESDGVSILAHPAICNSFAKKWFKETATGIDPFNFVKSLKEYGLEGVEIYNYNGVMKYSKPAADLINKYFKKLSEKLNLINTWGSDCHGNKWWGQQIGSFGSTTDDIKRFLTLCSSNKVL